MDQNWMGRYRPLVAALVQHTNINMKRMNARMPAAEGVFLSLHEWQVLECILENDSNHPMIQISSRLAIPQSSFSKIAKNLQELGLIEKYQLTGNKKNVILKATEKGRRIYREQAEKLDREMFSAFFNALEEVDDLSLARFVDALERFNGKLSEQQKKEEDEGQLIKIQNVRAPRRKKSEELC